MLINKIGCAHIHQSGSGLYWIVDMSKSLWYRITSVNGPFQDYESAHNQAEFDNDRMQEMGEE